MKLQPDTIFLTTAGTAPWACLPQASRGRLVAEPESPTRSVFQRDRDRIVHCGAFRRLKHKTQVFVYHEGDYYRTRLTHSLEVAQITRSICRVLGLNEDLAEALALAHDLGHPPFGHAGEAALDGCMQQFGGFDHNAQALRIVTRLEQRYASFDGLNLSWETLEGLVKHNGPLTGPGMTQALPLAIREYAELQDLELHSFPSAEAQVSALADDIAYCAHDIDDGLRAGLLDFEQMRQAPFAGPVFQKIIDQYPGVARGRLINEAVREMIGIMVDDLLAETKRRVQRERVFDAAHVRELGRPLIAFSSGVEEAIVALKGYLHTHVYRHYKVNRVMSQAKRILVELFNRFLAEPELLPPEWSLLCDQPGSRATARIVCDYVAGMTDRFALEEHGHLFQMNMKI
ncbi:MAG: dGTPase [Alphaproteobacteria bacterium]|nr:dGTPase [Alphaproteobacteria bacterium]